MTNREFERQLRWLMTVRVAIVTTLLVSAFTIELLFNPAKSLRPVFLLAAGSYGMVLLYAILDRWLQGKRSFILLLVRLVQPDHPLVSPLPLLVGGGEVWMHLPRRGLVECLQRGRRLECDWRHKLDLSTHFGG